MYPFLSLPSFPVQESNLPLIIIRARAVFRGGDSRSFLPLLSFPSFSHSHVFSFAFEGRRRKREASSVMPGVEINESRHERKLESLSRSRTLARSTERGGGEGGRRQSSGNLSRCGHFRFSDGERRGSPSHPLVHGRGSVGYISGRGEKERVGGGGCDKIQGIALRLWVVGCCYDSRVVYVLEGAHRPRLAL